MHSYLILTNDGVLLRGRVTALRTLVRRHRDLMGLHMGTEVLGIVRML